MTFSQKGDPSTPPRPNKEVRKRLGGGGRNKCAYPHYQKTKIQGSGVEGIMIFGFFIIIISYQFINFII
jgi:hypothetical protein